MMRRWVWRATGSIGREGAGIAATCGRSFLAVDVDSLEGVGCRELLGGSGSLEGAGMAATCGRSLLAVDVDRLEGVGCRELSGGSGSHACFDFSGRCP